MKKLSLLLLVLISAALSANAQDLIIRKNGQDIRAKVLEINIGSIKYRNWDNPESPVFTIPSSEVLLVRFEDGTNHITDYGLSSAAAEGLVKPGMKYKEYKDFYRMVDYTKMPGDRYSQWAGGLCSLLIPGLGQMVNGEVGRGFAFLGGSVGTYVTGYTGLIMILLSMGETSPAGPPSEGNTALAAGGAILISLSSLAWLGLRGWAIYDGVKVSRIKNMYERDLRDMASLSVSLEPYFSGISCLTPAGGGQIAAGASLKIRF